MSRPASPLSNATRAPLAPVALALLFVASLAALPACGPAELDPEEQSDSGTDTGYTIDGSGMADAGGDGADASTDGFTDGGAADDGANDAGTADGGMNDGGQMMPQPHSKPVTEEGDFLVGYREMTVTYQAKQDGTDEKRKLNLSVWYPARDTNFTPARYAGLLRRDGVYDQAPLANLDSYPVLVFSHGNGALAEQSFFMTEFWTSHGWVVVAPDHTGNTFRQGGSINLNAAIYRPQDVSAVIDHIYNLPADDPLSGKLTDEIVLSGHSFGAVTTIANSGATFAVDEIQSECEAGQKLGRGACDAFTKGERIALLRKGFYDDRIDVAIPQAPGGAQFFRDGMEKLKMPMLMMTGGMDRTLPNSTEGDPLWEYMKGDEHRRLDFPKGGHFTFSNMCDFFPSIEMVANDGCNDNFIEPELAYDYINAYAMAFARWHLWGDQRAKMIIDGNAYPVGKKHIDLSVGAE